MSITRLTNQTRYSSKDLLKLFAWFDDLVKANPPLSEGWERNVLQYPAESRITTDPLKVKYLPAYVSVLHEVDEHAVYGIDINLKVNATFPTGGNGAGTLCITSPARLFSRQDPLRVLAQSRNGMAGYLDAETTYEILRWYFYTGKLRNHLTSNLATSNRPVWEQRVIALRSRYEVMVKWFADKAGLSECPPVLLNPEERNDHFSYPLQEREIFNLAMQKLSPPTIRILPNVENPRRNRTKEERVAIHRKEFGDSSDVMKGGTRNPTWSWQSKILDAVQKYQSEWNRKEMWRRKMERFGVEEKPHMTWPEYLRHLANEFESQESPIFCERTDWSNWSVVRCFDFSVKKK